MRRSAALRTNKQTNTSKQTNECATRPATPPMRNTRPARKRGSNAAMTSTPKRHSGISADTGQGGLTVHRQLDARRHDRDAHLPNQTPHARLACVRASVWVCRCARCIVLYAMAAAAAQFNTHALRRAQRRTHTRKDRQGRCARSQAGPSSPTPSSRSRACAPPPPRPTPCARPPRWPAHVQSGAHACDVAAGAHAPSRSNTQHRYAVRVVT